MSTVDNHKEPIARAGRTRKAALAISATAIGTLGLLVVPQPAPAHAACDQFAFNGDYRVWQSPPVGPTVGFTAPPNSQDVKGGNGYIVGQGGGTLEFANIAKDSDGVSRISFQIRWSANSVGFYNGTVSPDGSASGNTIDADQPANQATWISVTKLGCYTPPKPPPPEPKKCDDGSTVPADQPCPPPPPPPPSELRLRYERHFGGITAFVSITNNDGKPAVACTYRDGLNTRDFTVTGKDETPIEFPGFPTGATYHVIVTCKNNLVTEQDVVY